MQRKKPAPRSFRAGPKKEMTFEFRFDGGQGREGREGHPRPVQKCRDVNSMQGWGQWVKQGVDRGEDGLVSRDWMTQSLGLPCGEPLKSVGCPEGHNLERFEATGGDGPIPDTGSLTPPLFCPREPAGMGCV